MWITPMKHLLRTANTMLPSIGITIGNTFEPQDITFGMPYYLCSMLSFMSEKTAAPVWISMLTVTQYENVT